MICFEESPM
uniref:Uncharacterized protein n=1 Tax=Rhizophora mucronata TaxID=61149 RepID=A0A2P2NWL5_RHIMU